MPGGTLEIHRDTDYLASGTHTGISSGVLVIDGQTVYIDGETITIGGAGAAGSPTLEDKTYEFRSNGIIPGQYIENVTQSTNSKIATVTEDQITTEDDIAWQNGDEYKIYKTSTKGGIISSQWVDLSRGVSSDRKKLVGGWFEKDIDIDDRGRKNIFGPGQPSRG